MIFNPVFIWAISVFYIGIYWLYSAESLHLFEPRNLYEPCFYLDKYGTFTAVYYYIYILAGSSRKLVKIGGSSKPHESPWLWACNNKHLAVFTNLVQHSYTWSYRLHVICYEFGFSATCNNNGMFYLVILCTAVEPQDNDQFIAKLIYKQRSK